MINRLKQLRKMLNLSQKELADKLQITQAGLSKIEVGGSTLTDRNIKTICEKFNVNEDWLRNGNEPIFVEPKENILENLKKFYDLDKNSMELIELFVNLDEFSKSIISNGIMTLIKNYCINNPDKLKELCKNEKR